MGVDYKVYVRELWDTIPQKYYKAKLEYEQLKFNFVDKLLSFIFGGAFGSATLDLTKEYELQAKVMKYEAMMNSLESDEFLTIVDKYFAGFFND